LHAKDPLIVEKTIYIPIGGAYPDLVQMMGAEAVFAIPAGLNQHHASDPAFAKCFTEEEYCCVQCLGRIEVDDEQEEGEVQEKDGAERPMEAAKHALERASVYTFWRWKCHQEKVYVVLDPSVVCC
jgi:hypothetical protein